MKSTVNIIPLFMSFFNSSDDKTRNSLIMTTYYVNRVMLTHVTVSSNTKYAGNFCFEFKMLSAVYFDNFKNISFLCKVLILAIAVRVIRLMTFKKIQHSDKNLFFTVRQKINRPYKSSYCVTQQCRSIPLPL